jgi:hypothetical protein
VGCNYGCFAFGFCWFRVALRKHHRLSFFKTKNNHSTVHNMTNYERSIIRRVVNDLNMIMTCIGSSVGVDVVSPNQTVIWLHHQTVCLSLPLSLPLSQAFYRARRQGIMGDIGGHGQLSRLGQQSLPASYPPTPSPTQSVVHGRPCRSEKQRWPTDMIKRGGTRPIMANTHALHGRHHILFGMEGAW